MVWFDDGYLSFEIIIVDWEFHQHGICTVGIEKKNERNHQ